MIKNISNKTANTTFQGLNHFNKMGGIKSFEDVADFFEKKYGQNPPEVVKGFIEKTKKIFSSDAEAVKYAGEIPTLITRTGEKVKAYLILIKMKTWAIEAVAINDKGAEIGRNLFSDSKKSSNFKTRTFIRGINMDNETFPYSDNRYSPDNKPLVKGIGTFFHKLKVEVSRIIGAGGRVTTTSTTNAMFFHRKYGFVRENEGALHLCDKKRIEVLKELKANPLLV